MNVALDAAASGQLVIGGFPAHNASGAVDRIIDLYPPEYRRQVQLALAENLRGVVAQVLLRKTGGGRVAAREVLLNTPAVPSVHRRREDVAAADGDRRRPPATAWCRSTTRWSASCRAAPSTCARRTAVPPIAPAFLALLKRQGMDTSLIERSPESQLAVCRTRV